MAEFCFVQVNAGGAQKPGRGRGGEAASKRNSKVMRQHVRRAVLRTRQQATLDGRMKHFTGTEFVTSKQAEQSSATTVDKKGALLKLEPAQSHSTTAWTVLTAQPTLRHPYTEYAASAVQLPMERIDYLFKSRTNLPLP